MLSISPENLPLLKVVLLLILSAHLALLGVLLGAVTATLVLDTFGRLDRRQHWRLLAAELVARAVPGRGTVLLLTVTAALLLTGVQLAFPALPIGNGYWLLTLAPLFAGLAALTAYRWLLSRRQGGPVLAFGLGAAGLLLALVSTFLLFSGAGLLVAPEKWPLLANDPRLLLTWVGSARFLAFTCLSLAATGTLLLILVRVPASADEQLAARLSRQRRAGAAMALVFLLAWPLTLLLDLYNLPTMALSATVYAVAATALAVAAVIALLLLGVIDRSRESSGRPIFSLLLLLFALWLLGEQLARENALDAATLSGLDAVVVASAPASAAEAATGEPAVTAETADGKAVFERLCATCHRFEERLVGPPLQSVLQKYRGDIEALAGFIRNPSKQDPAYPPMPKLQLSEAEISAVARYLLERTAP